MRTFTHSRYLMDENLATNRRRLAVNCQFSSQNDKIGQMDISLDTLTLCCVQYWGAFCIFCFLVKINKIS